MLIFSSLTSAIVLSISLSLDAFSMSLAYGLMNFSNKKIFLVSLLVGIFHFFMPILGSLIGKTLLEVININPKYIITVVFSLIIIEMIKSLKDKNIVSSLKLKETILFAFAVSLDSFSVGIGLAFLEFNILFYCFLFTVFSFLFTFIGFKLGKIISYKVGTFSKVLAIILLICLVLWYLK